MECGICLEEVKTEETFPCNHAFCIECVRTHLKTSIKCPLCRQYVQKREEALQECVLRTKTLLTMLECNFRKMASCDLDHVPFNDRSEETMQIKNIWQSVRNMAASLGLSDYVPNNEVWDWPSPIIQDDVGANSIQFSNWITNLLNSQVDVNFL